MDANKLKHTNPRPAQGKTARLPVMAVALAGLLCLLFVGCTQAGNSSSSGAPEPGALPDSSGSESASESSAPTEQAASFSITDGTVELMVQLDADHYDLAHPIGTTATITNQSEDTLFYVQGSSSNIAPDALQYTLGELAALFYPQAVTMDMLVAELAPGQALVLELDFVPYIAKDNSVAFGTDKDIDFFRSEEFDPASPGKITGSAVFHYLSAQDGSEANDLLFGAEGTRSLSLEFETTLI